MRTFIEYKPVTGDYEVTIVDPVPGGVHEYEVWEGDDRVAYLHRCDELTSEGVRLEPTLRLPIEVVDALLDYVRGEKPGDVLADAVADARKTRDDVLGLHAKTIDFIMRTAHRDFSS